MSVTLHPSVRLYDLPELETDALRMVVRALHALKENPEHPDGFRVDELGPSWVGLDLSGWRAMKLGGVSYDSALRIVFRLLDEETAEVISIGPRQGSVCFQTAMDRLSAKSVPCRRRMRTHTRKDFANHHVRSGQ